MNEEKVVLQCRDGIIGLWYCFTIYSSTYPLDMLWHLRYAMVSFQMNSLIKTTWMALRWTKNRQEKISRRSTGCSLWHSMEFAFRLMRRLNPVASFSLGQSRSPLQSIRQDLSSFPKGPFHWLMSLIQFGKRKSLATAHGGFAGMLMTVCFYSGTHMMHVKCIFSQTNV